MAFAVWDATRKGSGVTLSGGNLVADINGLYMVAATNPVDISTATGYYAEFAVPNTSTFIGFGPCKSTTLTDQYLGAYSDQFALWQDATTDSGGGITYHGSFSFGSILPQTVKFAVKGNKLWYGLVGAGTTGWYNPSSGNFDGDPTTGNNPTLDGFAAGLWSLGVTSTSTAAHCTANFGASAWSGTPPSGFVGWPAAGGGITLTGQAITGARGSFKPSTRKTLTGAAITGAQGTAKAGTRKTLSGQASTAAQGTAKPSVQPHLAGQAGTLSLGAFAKRIAAGIAGLAIVGATGTLKPRIAPHIAGQQSTSAAGTLKPQVRVALNGLQINTARGSFSTGTPPVTANLTGAAITAAAGTFKPSTRASVAGTASTLARGSFKPSTQPHLTGAALTAARGSLGLLISVHPLGQAISMAQGSIHPPGQVTVALTGQAIVTGAGSFRASTQPHLQGRQFSTQRGVFGLRMLAHLTGAEVDFHQGVFLNTRQTPKLVSLTIKQAGNQLTFFGVTNAIPNTVTFKNGGLIGNTTFNSLD